MHQCDNQVVTKNSRFLVDIFGLDFHLVLLSFSERLHTDTILYQVSHSLHHPPERFISFEFQFSREFPVYKAILIV